MIKGSILILVLVCYLNLTTWIDAAIQIQNLELMSIENIKIMKQNQSIHYQMLQEVRFYLLLNDNESYQGDYQISCTNNFITIRDPYQNVEIVVEIIENEIFDYVCH
ncbi:MAG: hypothetical protein R3Y57_01510 [Erysipelotrichaceae bacterium]